MSEFLKQVPLNSKKNLLQLNPRIAESLRQQMSEIFDRHCQEMNYENTLGLMTSGTTSENNEDFKIIILSQSALLASAQAVNQWIHGSEQDIWSLGLPTFHVGGLGVLARAHLSRASVVSFLEEKWQAENFVSHLSAHKVTLTSLVPTQIFDLVHKGLKAPSCLRLVFVGGGDLSNSLYEQARVLGWPLMLTYGMTEMSSQVACSQMQDLQSSHKPDLYLMPHMRAQMSDKKTLCLQSPAQLTGVVERRQGIVRTLNYSSQDFFCTEDLVELQTDSRGLKVRPLGRGADFVKILGENVSLKKLRSLWSELIRESAFAFQLDWHLCAVPDERRGYVLFMITTQAAEESVKNLIPVFNQKVLPFERVSQWVAWSELPRTDLGKIKEGEILARLTQRKS